MAILWNLHSKQKETKSCLKLMFLFSTAIFQLYLALFSTVSGTPFHKNLLVNNAFSTVYIHETALRCEMKAYVMSAVAHIVKDGILKGKKN
jgi:hypothetical protein